MHVRRPVRLLEMEDITSPALTIGLRPTVLLPSTLAGADREEGGSSTARERRSAELEREKERITTALHILNSQVPDCGVRPQT